MPLLTEFKGAIEWYFYKYYTPKGVENPGINPYKISSEEGNNIVLILKYLIRHFILCVFSKMLLLEMTAKNNYTKSKDLFIAA